MFLAISVVCSSGRQISSAKKFCISRISAARPLIVLAFFPPKLLDLGWT
jgi:hypothetical protein